MKTFQQYLFNKSSETIVENKDKIYENFNREGVNFLIQRLAKERNDAIQQGGTGGKFASLTQDEFQQLKGVEEVAKNKVLSFINNQFSNDWKIYKEWENQHGSKNLRFALFTNNLGSYFQKGQSTYIDGHVLVCSPGFYNVLLWRKHVKDFSTLLVSNSIPLTQIKSLTDGLKILSSLVNS